MLVGMEIFTYLHIKLQPPIWNGPKVHAFLNLDPIQNDVFVSSQCKDLQINREKDTECGDGCPTYSTKRKEIGYQPSDEKMDILITLMGPTRDDQVLDPLTWLHLEN